MAFDTPGLIKVFDKNVRITGLRIEGPDKDQQLDHYMRSFQIRMVEGDEKILDRNYYYKFPAVDGILVKNDKAMIDNCELWGWSHAAIFLRSGKDHIIQNNFIHHNQRQGLGYGISHDNSTSIIVYNLFNFNRHSIAGTGVPGSGYIARNNVQLENSLSHCFDMHGGRDRKDGTEIAGRSIIISNNTFFSEKKAIAIRGIPEESATVTKNIFYQKELGPDVITDWMLAENVKVFENKFDSENILKKRNNE